MEREAKREPYSQILEGKIERKEKTIKKNTLTIEYWEKAIKNLDGYE